MLPVSEFKNANVYLEKTSISLAQTYMQNF